MEKIVFAGSFDPLTNGHLWVIEQGLEMAGTVLVFVAHNHNKKTMFSAAQRKVIIEEVVAQKGLADRVQVHIIQNEYVAKKALQMGASHMIRGIRSAIDFDYETLLQKTNTDILHGAKTVFVMPPRDLESVSSSFVKSLVGPVGWHWQIKKFLPQAVYDTWLQLFITQTAQEFIKHELMPDFIKEVIDAYSAPERHYHGIEHIVHCLQEMLWLYNHQEATQQDSGIDFSQLCAAILGHDIIQGVHGGESDEVLSAKYVNGILGTRFHKASKMIHSTQHFVDATQLSLEDKVMRSIDLAILGQDEDIYDRYAKNIRLEYAHVPEKQYNEARIKALEQLLAHQPLYEHESFAHYEQMAKANLKREIARLQMSGLES